MEETKEELEIKLAKKVWKMNTIALAKHHRKYCEGEDCNISLNVLRLMAEACGVEFTKEEYDEFI